MNFGQNTDRPLDATFTFYGEYTRAVDAKGRFALPFRFRQGGSGAVEEKYVVTKGADGTLTLQPKMVYDARLQRMNLAPPSAELRANIRRMSRSAIEVKPDSQGRVAVTPEILKKFGIRKKITVVGMGSYMELWDPGTLEKLDTDEVDSGFMDEFYR